MQSLWCFDLYKDGVEYGVLDDIDWDFIPNKKAFFGCQSNYVISGKYRTPTYVKGGFPIIYCTNYAPNFGHDGDWFRENVTVITLTEPLYARE